MMNSKSLFRTVILAAIAVFSVAGAVFFFLAVSGEFEPALGYFTTDSSFAPILYVALAMGPVLGLIMAVSQKKNVSATRSLPGNSSLLMKVLSILLGVAVTVSTVMGIMSTFNGAPQKYMTITYISWALAELSVVYFIRSVLVREDEASPLTCLLSFLPPLFYASMVLVLYFDRSVAVNSPIQIISQIALIAFMLNVTAEAGIILGRKKLYSKLLFTLCSSTVICAILGLGSVICLVTSTDFPVQWDMAIIMCASALYSAGRLISLTGYKTEIFSKKAPEENSGSGDSEK